MSEQTPTTTGHGGGAYKVLSVRTSEDTRAQLEVLAQVNERSVTEETRIALEHWVATSKSDPAVLKRAEQVRADIERDAATKRNAINALLGDKDGKTAGRAPKQVPKASTTGA